MEFLDWLKFFHKFSAPCRRRDILADHKNVDYRNTLYIYRSIVWMQKQNTVNGSLETRSSKSNVTNYYIKFISEFFCLYRGSHVKKHAEPDEDSGRPAKQVACSETFRLSLWYLWVDNFLNNPRKICSPLSVLIFSTCSNLWLLHWLNDWVICYFIKVGRDVTTDMII